MESLSLVGKGTSHSEGRRRSVEVGTRLGAGVEAEGVVAELVSKLRSLVDRRHSRLSIVVTADAAERFSFLEVARRC